MMKVTGHMGTFGLHGPPNEQIIHLFASNDLCISWLIIQSDVVRSGSHQGWLACVGGARLAPSPFGVALD